MALLFMDGFDAGDSLIKWQNTGAGNATTTNTRFNQGRALYINTNAVIKRFPACPTTIIGVAFGGTALSPSTYMPIINFYTDNGASLQIGVGLSSTAILLYRGSTLIASYAGTFLPNSYYYIEASVTIDPTAGSVVVKYLGNVVINFTGNTKATGTNNTLDGVMLNSNGAGGLYDDFYLCDTSGPAPYNTFLGETRIVSLSPSGAGSSTQFTPSTGPNYTTVDELPYSNTDYVTSSASGTRDTYAMSDLPATAGSVLAVQNNIIARKTDAPTVSLKPVVKSGATLSYGSAIPLGGVDSVLMDIRTTDPATSAGWTKSAVNALEAGFEIA